MPKILDKIKSAFSLSSKGARPYLTCFSYLGALESSNVITKNFNFSEPSDCNLPKEILSP